MVNIKENAHRREVDHAIYEKMLIITRGDVIQLQYFEMIAIASIRTLYLWGWYDREGVHDSIWIFLTDLADEQRTHARASAAT